MSTFKAAFDRDDAPVRWSAFLLVRGTGISQPGTTALGRCTTFNSSFSSTSEAIDFQTKAMPDSNGKKPVFVLRRTCLKRYNMKLSNIGGTWEASGKASFFFKPISPLSTNTDLTQGRKTPGWHCWLMADAWTRTGSSPAGGRRTSSPERLPCAIRKSRGSLAWHPVWLSLWRWQACRVALIKID